MSFRHGAKGIMMNPKPCSIKTAALIKLFYLQAFVLRKYKKSRGIKNTLGVCSGCENFHNEDYPRRPRLIMRASFAFRMKRSSSMPT